MISKPGYCWLIEIIALALIVYRIISLRIEGWLPGDESKEIAVDAKDWT